MIIMRAYEVKMYDAVCGVMKSQMKLAERESRFSSFTKFVFRASPILHGERLFAVVNRPSAVDSRRLQSCLAIP